MDELVRWLGEQLDEDERIARAATAGPWRAHDTHLGQYGHTATVLSGEGNTTDLRAWLPSQSHEPWDEKRNVWADAAHIAEHDPARVLREVEAKRRIIEQHERYAAERRRMMGGWDPQSDDSPILAALASVYADRPGYQDAWRP